MVGTVWEQVHRVQRGLPLSDRCVGGPDGAPDPRLPSPPRRFREVGSEMARRGGSAAQRAESASEAARRHPRWGHGHRVPGRHAHHPGHRVDQPGRPRCRVPRAGETASKKPKAASPRRDRPRVGQEGRGWSRQRLDAPLGHGAWRRLSVCNLLTDPTFVQLPPEHKCHEHGSLSLGQSWPRLKCCAQRYLLHGRSSETHCGTNWTAGLVTPAQPGRASHRQRPPPPAEVEAEARTRPAGPRHRGSALHATRSALPRAPAGAASGAGPGAAEFSRHQPRVCRPRPPVALGQ